MSFATWSLTILFGMNLLIFLFGNYAIPSGENECAAPPAFCLIGNLIGDNNNINWNSFLTWDTIKDAGLVLSVVTLASLALTRLNILSGFSAVHAPLVIAGALVAYFFAIPNFSLMFGEVPIISYLLKIGIGYLAVMSFIGLFRGE